MQNTITVIDETIREGMQYRGIVFSQQQREDIIDFQEQLGVDICQAGYAPAHITEQINIKYLNQIVRQKGYNIKITAMGRASIRDAKSLLQTGVSDFHLHAHIQDKSDKSKIEESLQKIKYAVDEIRKEFKSKDNLNLDSNVSPTISIAVLDIGTSLPEQLETVASFLVNELNIDILSLPDTSGIMPPDSFYDVIREIALSEKVGLNLNMESDSDNSTSSISRIKNGNLKKMSQLSVHCHNDLGMASANTLMGVKAGATVVELSALGIGERNGIGDIFTVSKMLKDKGYNIRVDTDNVELFKKYYRYVSDICKSQTGEALLNYNTPFFGDGVKTHVAGTHAQSGFGLFDKEEYYINVLCGKQLVRNYLESRQIPFLPEQLSQITDQIKLKSAQLNRRLEQADIADIVSKI